MTCRLRWLVKIETRCRIPIRWTFGWIPWHVIPEPRATLQGAATWWIPELYVTLQGAVRVQRHVIPEPRMITLQGAATWWIHCCDSRATFHIAGCSHLAKSMCLPSVALPWGQPAWQGLGFSGLVHEETHPCGSNFIQSVFKTVRTRCIDSVLIQIVPFVNNTIWNKILSNVNIESYFTYFLTVAS